VIGKLEERIFVLEPSEQTFDANGGTGIFRFLNNLISSSFAIEINDPYGFVSMDIPQSPSDEIEYVFTIAANNTSQPRSAQIRIIQNGEERIFTVGQWANGGGKIQTLDEFCMSKGLPDSSRESLSQINAAGIPYGFEFAFGGDVSVKDLLNIHTSAENGVCVVTSKQRPETTGEVIVEIQECTDLASGVWRRLYTPPSEVQDAPSLYKYSPTDPEIDRGFYRLYLKKRD